MITDPRTKLYLTGTPELRAALTRGLERREKPWQGEMDLSGIQLIADALCLGENGLPYSRADTPYRVDNSDNYRQLWELQRLLPALFKGTLARRGWSSYGMKHMLEDFLPLGYVSNSSLIVMMTYLGIRWSYYKEKTLNMNVREKIVDGDLLLKSLAHYSQNRLRWAERHGPPPGSLAAGWSQLG